MKKQNLFKTQKGITLVALVVTIVVLLILAGISINLVLGQNGIVAKSKEAKDKTANASTLEKINLAVGEAMLEGLGDLSTDKLEDALAKQFENVSVSETDETYVITITENGVSKEYVIGKNGEVSELVIKKDEKPGELEVLGADRFEINSIEDLVALSYSVNSGDPTYLGKTIELGKTLDFASDSSYGDPEAKYVLEEMVGYKPAEDGTSLKELLLGTTGYIPIGEAPSDGFYGTIEGNNNKIKNINITNPTAIYGGFIGKSATNQTLNIRNLGIDGGVVAGQASLGGILAYSNGTTTIENCFNTAQIKSGASAGGLVGNAGVGTLLNISNSYNAGAIEGWNATGGIVGNGDKTSISCCFNSGRVLGGQNEGRSPAGGIAGYADNISNCYNIGAIANDGHRGGIACFVNETMTNCYNAGKLEGDEAYFEYYSGIVYSNYNANIANCYYLEGTAGTGIEQDCEGETTKVTAMDSDTFLESLKGSEDNTVWTRVDGENEGRPILSWQVNK